MKKRVERYGLLWERVSSLIDRRWKQWSTWLTTRVNRWSGEVRFFVFVLFVVVVSVCCAYVIWNAFQ